MAATARIREAASALAFRLLGEPRFERLRARSVARDIKARREHEDEIDLLGDFVHRGETAIDAGANFGLYSFHLARLVGDDGKVLAFEAIPGTCTSLRRVLQQLDVSSQVEVVERALGAFSGSVDFVLPRRRGGTADRGRAWLVPSGAAASSVERVRVEMVALDEAVDERLDITFIKVDTEGADLFVLRGAAALLERCAPTIVVEVAPDALARHGVRPGQLDELFERHGYSTYVYRRPGSALVPCRAAEVNGNLVAIHPRRAECASRFLG